MVQKRLSVRGWPSGSPIDSEECVAFGKLGNIHCRIEKFSLEEVNEAYERMMDGKARFRAVLTF